MIGSVFVYVSVLKTAGYKDTKCKVRNLGQGEVGCKGIKLCN